MVSRARTIRVAPDYDGRWSGVQIVTACRDSGELRGICEGPDFRAVIGGAYPIELNARHPSGPDLSGEFVVEQTTFPTFTTTVEDDGTIRFAAVAELDDFRMATGWIMHSASVGRASGTIVEVWSFPGLLQGDLTWESTFTDLGKAGSTAMSPLSSLRTGQRARLLGLLRDYRRW